MAATAAVAAATVGGGRMDAWVFLAAAAASEVRSRFFFAISAALSHHALSALGALLAYDDGRLRAN